MFRKTLAGLLTLVFVLALAAPADAFSGPGGFGSRVRCYNRTVAGGPTGPYWEWELRRLHVTPPEFSALSAGQTVGWRFIVHRSLGDNVWTTRYRSPIQTATASSDGDVSLASMGVRVDVPEPGYDTFYRVAIKVFWYRADGSIRRTDKQGVNSYRIWIDGQFRWTQSGSCEGRAGFAV